MEISPTVEITGSTSDEAPPTNQLGSTLIDPAPVVESELSQAEDNAPSPLVSVPLSETTSSEIVSGAQPPTHNNVSLSIHPMKTRTRAGKHTGVGRKDVRQRHNKSISLLRASKGLNQKKIVHIMALITTMESSIADLLLGKIVSIFENEVVLLSGFRDEVKEIKLELISMRSLLEDADKRRVHSRTESAWISSVRDMVFELSEPRRTVVSVVGMGGLGKTTLVANTFNKQIVKQHFDCCAWITVSQQYMIQEILKSMVKEVCEKANEDALDNLSSMSYRDLVKTLVEILQTKRYLIVLDDVWHINFWHDITIALPTNITGSRILLTTRMEDIASFEFDVVNFVFPLNPLTDEASWNLFCKKAFANKHAQCPPYLDPLARNLVAKCEGLPLAIVALGGLMASRKSLAEWNEIYSLSNASYIVAFFQKIIGLREKGSLDSGWQKEKEIKVCQGIRRLRSLFAFAYVDISQSSFNMLASGFKLLRVLDLEDAPILELPRELVNLFNLRYLNLTRTKVKELPKSIGKLSNLQSLIAKETQIKELPPGIVKLKNLRHLVAYYYNFNSIMEFEIGSGIRVPSDICSLGSLQVLSVVEARGNLTKQLSRMTQLKLLQITKVKEADYENLCNSIGNMRFLRTLTVTSYNEDEVLKMDALEVAPPLLEKLFLSVKLEKIPHWLKSLHSLTILVLNWSRLREDFLPHI
ncbi:Disease resistance protein [Corchorus capsularis]|uniref:Disease resistance protein n=1 Tax=Corchorus capsularis TaxID=210143 RepID=A0A1R3HHW8_COCAP|nr:Disease resistance protein [Corchorus capsularis]